MQIDPLPILIGVLLVALIVAGYLISETVPIFIAAVLGLPVTAYVLNRTSPPKSDS
jgi:hypothetical protein